MQQATKLSTKALYKEVIKIADLYNAETEFISNTLFISYPILGQGSAIMQLINDRIGVDADYLIKHHHAGQQLIFKIIGE